MIRRAYSTVYVSAEDSLHADTQKLVVVLCGLPARGKSFLANKICRFLTWNGLNVRTFNVGSYRRKALSGMQDHTFFDHSSAENNALRNKLAMDVLEDLISWLKTGGNVAIHDATNTTRSRRTMILDRLRRETDINVMFVESVCNDETIIEANIRLKLNSPDYIGMDPEQALDDFRQRLKGYEKVYEPLNEELDDGIPFIKLIDVGKRVLANRIHGYLQSQILFYLANYHVQPRTIWLCRHGECENNVQGRIGGDSSLTPAGVEFSQRLAKFLMENEDLPRFKVWTSSLSRSVETAVPLIEKYKANPLAGKITRISKLRQLNEIYAGACEGMSYDEIREKMPQEFAAREQDKLRYRYPLGGESYMDMIQRLKPIIIELERETSHVVIIAHTAVIRTIMAYFKNVKIEELPYIDVPLHELICLTPTPYGCEEKRYSLGPELTTHNNENVSQATT